MLTETDGPERIEDDSAETLARRLIRLQEVNEQLVFGLLRAHEVELEARHLKLTALYASEVQRSLLPPMADIPGLDIHATLISRDEVGGDFYDVVQFRRRVTFIIGDVMGKGMPAALMMVMALAQFREATRVTSCPAKILSAANERLYESMRNSNTNNLVSAAVLSIDLNTWTARFARAGHEGLVVYRAKDRSVVMEVPPGLLLGVREGEAYRSVAVPIAPGDLLVLFTDGISEARSVDGEFFGAERLGELVRTRTEPNLQTFGDQVVAEVRRFQAGGQLRDDVVLLLIGITA